MNVVLYVRVSSAEQVNGYSLEAQITELRAWCQNQGYIILDVYEEQGKSAKSDDRPIFQKLIRDMEKRTINAGGVVVHRLDRFARNLPDLLTYKARLALVDVQIFSATEQFLNGNSAEDEFMLHIFGAVAQYDNRKRASESKKGIDAMLRLGIYPGPSLPMGYHRVGEKRHARIEIDPETAPIIQNAFNEYASGGWQLRTWAKEAKSRGWPHQPGRWQHVFRNIFYIGQFVWAGEVYQGQHPPLIKKEVFTHVNQILTAENSGGKQKKYNWLLKGFLWSCVHNRPMTGDMAKGQYPYYRAKTRFPGKQPDHAIRAEELEARVIDLLGNIRASGEPLPIPEQWEWGLKAVPNLKLMWETLPTKKAKKQLLNLVFFSPGIQVQESGRVEVERIKAGFERID